MKKRAIMFLICLLVPVFTVVVNGCKKDDPVDPQPPEEEYVIDDTPFDNVPATEDIVMYEVNFLAFSSSGTIDGVTNKLDSLKNLGVNVVWLMPVFPIGDINSVNSPYSVKNYTEVNPDLGTLNDLRELVSKAHDKDMAVILDWVANHTAWDNPWIENTDWYTQDESGNIVAPIADWADVADLNFDNEEMRLEMIKSMKYWITTANVDGFRCDAADWVPTDFWKQALDSLKNIPGRDLVLLAEGDKNENLSAGFQLSFAWDYNTKLRNIFAAHSAGSLFAEVEQEYVGVPDGKCRLHYTTNHDLSAWDGSLTEFYHSAEGSLAAFVITAFIKGVPMIYTGQEVAYPSNIAFFTLNPIDWNINPEIREAYKSILSVRSGLDAAKGGEVVGYPDDDVVAFKKVKGSQEVLVIVNVRSENTSFALPDEIDGTTWTDSFVDNEVTLSSTYDLGPYEYVILKNE